MEPRPHRSANPQDTAWPADYALDGGRADRLVTAAARQISEHGQVAASARAITALAGSAASAVNYNFGGVERLLSAAYTYGIRRTEAWLATQQADLIALPPTPAAMAHALERVIDAWTVAQRPLALLYQECLAGCPDPAVRHAWARVWRRFWLDLAAAFGRTEMDGRLMHALFESEALYNLSTWSPALEQAALRDVCGQFAVVCLGGPPRPPSGALALAELRLGTNDGSPLPGTAVKIAAACAAVVAQGGLGGLTHRAVAAAAHLTTGAVTHHFRTVEDLVAGAIRSQVTDMLAGQDVRQVLGALDPFLDATFASAAGETAPTPITARRSLFLAAVRRPDLASAGAVIRFAHGGTGRQSLGPFLSADPIEVSAAAGLLSRIISAVWVASLADPEPAQDRAATAADFLARFRASLAPKG